MKDAPRQDRVRAECPPIARACPDTLDPLKALAGLAQTAHQGLSWKTMARRVQLLLGTRKGAFILESDPARREWDLRGPYCETWPIHHLIRSPDGTLYAGGGSPWYGASVWRSEDEGATWTQSSEGLTYGEDGPKLMTVWNLTASDGSLFAGVEPAGLFRSED
ncbi:MAG: WD40/YVTN/BNR-like repeat-containing protein, partial [Candidatus Limnocylindrales bacterium]